MNVVEPTFGLNNVPLCIIVPKGSLHLETNFGEVFRWAPKCTLRMAEHTAQGSVVFFQRARQSIQILYSYLYVRC